MYSDTAVSVLDSRYTPTQTQREGETGAEKSRQIEEEECLFMLHTARSNVLLRPWLMLTPALHVPRCRGVYRYLDNEGDSMMLTRYI